MLKNLLLMNRKIAKPARFSVVTELIMSSMKNKFAAMTRRKTYTPGFQEEKSSVSSLQFTVYSLLFTVYGLLLTVYCLQLEFIALHW